MALVGLLLLAPARAQAPAVASAPDGLVAAPAVQRPALPRDASALGARISGRVANALAVPCLAGAHVGIVVRDAASGEVIFEDHGDDALAPASNMKLVTGSAALDLLGPERALKTTFRGEHAPDPQGAIGALHVVGGGDPSLTIEALYLAARALAMRGVRRVDDVVVDDSFFAGTPRPPSWPVRNCGTWYGAPCAALGANFNVVAVHAQGAARPGAPATVFVDPFPAFFDVSALARTSGGSSGIGAKSTLRVDAQGQTIQHVDVTGRLRPGRAQRVLVPVEDPALFCGHGVVESLRRVGIEVQGIVRRGPTPPSSVLLHVQASRPMALVVHDMEKESSNVYAETLLKVLGAELYGAPGTREKGIEVLRAWLEALSPGGACHLMDGSGLSPEDRLTPRILTDLLLVERAQGTAFTDLLAALPVSGADGTLRKRLRTPEAKRNVRAKTGRIAQVAALSGFAEIGEGRQAVFSVLVNEYHCPSWKAEAALDDVIEALVKDAGPVVDWRKRLNLPPAPEETDEVEGSDVETETPPDGQAEEPATEQPDPRPADDDAGGEPSRG
jgi:D-alanyl-D-alanine carboxypeptidase/D-alanyl-D-alanine-endopeptidase (penicillin-binding protein 4)